MSIYDEQSGTTPPRSDDGPQARRDAEGTARFAASSGGSTQQGPAGSTDSPYGGGTGGTPYTSPTAGSAPGAPYTSAPQTPLGYNFARSSSAPGSGYSDDPVSGFGAGDRPPYAAASASADGDGHGGRHRGPGWGGVIVTSVVVTLLACAGTAAGMHYLDRGTATTASSGAPTSIATGATTQTVSSNGTTPDWEAVTTAVSNAVVAITVEQNQTTSLGSGVIYDSSGHIVTNNHVVSGASRIQVTLADGRIYEANLTGTDEATDLAVIAIDNPPADLTVAQLGDSGTLATGQDVMAIGNPLGLSSTVTTGIVSALDRPVVTTQEENDDSSGSGGSGIPGGGLGGLFGQQNGQNGSQASRIVTNAIQIDAAINPGNSGGPLFDETGKVIGITSSIASTSRSSSSSENSGSIGIGFAIPSNLAQKVADQLISTGTATHAYLGVSIEDGGGTAGGVTRAGAQINSVETDSPAQKAGLKEGDVITAIDGKMTSQAAALTGFVRQYSANDQVTLTVIRDDQELEVPVTLSERKDS